MNLCQQAIILLFLQGIILLSHSCDWIAARTSFMPGVGFIVRVVGWSCGILLFFTFISPPNPCLRSKSPNLVHEHTEVAYPDGCRLPLTFFFFNHGHSFSHSFIYLFIHSYAAYGCLAASLSGGVTVPLMLILPTLEEVCVCACARNNPVG